MFIIVFSVGNFTFVVVVTLTVGQCRCEGRDEHVDAADGLPGTQGQSAPGQGHCQPGALSHQSAKHGRGGISITIQVSTPALL